MRDITFNVEDTFIWQCVVSDTHPYLEETIILYELEGKVPACSFVCPATYSLGKIRTLAESHYKAYQAGQRSVGAVPQEYQSDDSGR